MVLQQLKSRALRNENREHSRHFLACFQIYVRAKCRIEHESVMQSKINHSRQRMLGNEFDDIL
jgi:hypothetical protein